MTAPDLEALLSLQELDTHADQETHRRAHLPQRAELLELQKTEGALRSARDKVAAALAEVASRQAAAEKELKATEDRLGQVNARLFGGTVTASRELQAMSSDVEGLRKRASELEDRVLLALEEREPWDSEVAALDHQLADIDKGRQVLSDQLAVAEAKSDADLAELLAQRPGRAQAVPGTLLEAYDRLRPSLGGVAVARLVGGRCDGCHLSLPAVELDRIRHQAPGAVEYCEQCGRILVMASV